VCELLRRNVASLSACVVHELGCSSRAGRAAITYYPGATAMSGLYADPERDRELVRTVLVKRGMSPAQADRELAGRYEPQVRTCELTTLSSFLREQHVARVDLLKVDVERAELDVLRGIDDGDWQQIRQVVIEVHDEGGRGARIADMLSARGFRIAWDQEEDMTGTSIRMLYGRRP
jgi:FkbM family methyltransferase